MRMRIIFAIGLILGITLLGIGCPKAQKKSAPPTEGQEAEYVKDEILVKFKKGVTKERIGEINKRFGVVVIRVLAEVEIYHLRIPEDSTVPKMVKRYKNLPEVEYAQPNYRYRILQGPILE